MLNHVPLFGVGKLQSSLLQFSKLSTKCGESDAAIRALLGLFHEKFLGFYEAAPDIKGKAGARAYFQTLCKIPAPNGFQFARNSNIRKRIIGNTVYSTNFFSFGTVSVRFRAVHQFCGDKLISSMTFFEVKRGEAIFRVP